MRTHLLACIFKQKICRDSGNELHGPCICTIITMRVRPSYRPPARQPVYYQLVQMFITFEPHGKFLLRFAYICMSTLPNHWHANRIVFDRYWIAVQLSGLLGSVSKILIPLQIYEIFESYFAYLFILILFSHPGMQMGDKGLLSITLVVQSKIVLCIICDHKCTPEMWKKLKSFWVRNFFDLADNKFSIAL